MNIVKKIASILSVITIMQNSAINIKCGITDDKLTSSDNKSVVDDKKDDKKIDYKLMATNDRAYIFGFVHAFIVATISTSVAAGLIFKKFQNNFIDYEAIDYDKIDMTKVNIHRFKEERDHVNMMGLYKYLYDIRYDKRFFEEDFVQTDNRKFVEEEYVQTDEKGVLKT